MSEIFGQFYTAPDEKNAVRQLGEVDTKRTPQYPAATKRWHDHWDVITPIFTFSMGLKIFAVLKSGFCAVVHYLIKKIK